MKEYIIELVGCDDTTQCKIKLSKEEFETFYKIAKQVNTKSINGCQPVIRMYDNWIEEINTWDSENLLEVNNDRS